MIQKIKKQIIKILPFTLEAAKFLGMIFFIGAAAVKGPELHLRYLRYTVAPKVVKVTNNGGGGTGFYVKAPSGDTYILTNKHVCGTDPTKKVNVIDQDGTTRVRQIYMVSMDHDLCLIYPAESDVEGLDLQDKGIDVGDQVAIIGHPHLTPLAVARGTYNGQTPMELPFAFMLNIPEVLQVGWTDAASYPGNSGSPVVNFYGDVVGVLFAGSAAHVNMIVPLTEIKRFLKGL